MFTIGDFARHGRVSVRMLRHYDGIGLLEPSYVAPVTGYRYYSAGQLARLNRIVALRDLGFTLEQIRPMLDDKVDLGELTGMLRLRQAELTEQLAADTARLRGVEARLRSLAYDAEPVDVVVKALPAVRVAELTGLAAGYYPEAITPVIRPLYGTLHERLARAGVRATGPNLAYYDDAPDGVVVHACVPVDALPDGTGLDLVELPAVPKAATVLHRGPMDDVLPLVQALARWIEDNGYQPAGASRELTVACPGDDPAEWVTELQEPVVPADRGSN
jgi:DNA-binding transcriptional MerR regulator